MRRSSASVSSICARFFSSAAIASSVRLTTKLELLRAALAALAVEVEVALDLGQRRADRLGAQDQRQPRAVAARVDARAVDAARREQALVFVEAQRAQRDAELAAELGDAVELGRLVAAVRVDEARAPCAVGRLALGFTAAAQ